MYQALKANPPTAIPDRHLETLRSGRASCEAFEEGLARPYMTCWWPNGAGTEAYLSWYGNGLRRPRPESAAAPGGSGITGYLPVR